MLEPKDYGGQAIQDKTTRAFMDKIVFEHGGPDYDSKYPDGIPTSVEIKLKGTLNSLDDNLRADLDGKMLDSKLVMYPSGHARNTSADLKDILNHKFNLIGRLALSEGDLTE